MNEVQLTTMLEDIADCFKSPENRADNAKLRQVHSSLKLLKIASIDAEVLKEVEAPRVLRQAFGQLVADPEFAA
mgnify:CR=1 FL=1|jgi:hypothetical protein